MGTARVPAKTFASAEAQAFREGVRAWLATVVPRFRERLAAAKGLAAWEAVQQDWDRETYRGGYSGISWPVEHGGQGLGQIEDVVFYEECAHAKAPMGLGRFAQHLIGGVLIEFGTPRQKEMLLPGILSGEIITCQGSSEPHAGSDLPAVRTRAIRTETGYEIRGRKTWTSNAHVAKWCWMLCRTSETAPRYRNLSLLLVRMDQPAITISPINQITGTSRFSEVTFDGALTGHDMVVGGVDRGWQTMVTALGRERGVYMSMWRYLELQQLVTQARACIEHTGRGSPTELDDLEMAVAAVKWQVQRCVEGRIAGRNTVGSETMLKLYWAKLWQDVATFAMDLRCPEHGAWFRESYFESRAATIWGGTTEIQRNTIADHVLKLPRFDRAVEAKAG